MAQQAAFGTLIAIDNGGSYGTIAYVRDIGGPNISLDTIEVTTHSSTGGWREFIAGLLDGGEVSLDLFIDLSQATQGNSTGLLSELTGRTVEGFRITWPDASTATFNALVTNWEPGAVVDGALSGSVTLKITGAVTFA